MADRQRPMPKQRPEEASNGRPNSIIDIPFGGTTQPLHISTATMYDTRAVDDNMSRRTQRGIKSVMLLKV